MKQFIQMSLFHLKRYLQKPDSLMNSFGMPLVVIAGLVFVFSQNTNSNSTQSIEVVSESSEINNDIYPHLSENIQDTFSESKDESFSALERTDLDAVYVIPENFIGNNSINEKIEVYSLNGENQDPMFESQLLNEISEITKNNAYENANIQLDSIEVSEPVDISSDNGANAAQFFTIFMLLFFMTFNSGLIAGDLAVIRKNQLLKRSVISYAKTWKIFGSILAGYSLLLFISNFSLLALFNLIFDLGYSLELLGVVFALFLATTIFTLGISMILFRIFKNKDVITVIGTFVPMIYITITYLPEQYEIISKISPYYWAIEALETGNWIIPCLMISLFGIIFFTAGNLSNDSVVQKS